MKWICYLIVLFASFLVVLSANAQTQQNSIFPKGSALGASPASNSDVGRALFARFGFCFPTDRDVVKFKLYEDFDIIIVSFETCLEANLNKANKFRFQIPISQDWMLSSRTEARPKSYISRMGKESSYSPYQFATTWESMPDGPAGESRWFQGTRRRITYELSLKIDRPEAYPEGCSVKAQLWRKIVEVYFAENGNCNGKRYDYRRRIVTPVPELVEDLKLKCDYLKIEK